MRKRLILGALCAIAMATAASAQDKLITVDGDVILGYRIDVGGSSIYYRLEDSDNAPLQSIAKDKVLMINKQDGTKVRLYDNDNAPQQASAPAGNTSSATTGNNKVTYESLSDAEKEANNKYIGLFNQDVISVVDNNGKKVRDANAAYTVFAIKEQSVIMNKDILVIPIMGSLLKEGNSWKFYYNKSDLYSAITFHIENLSSNTIYLDLGNTFFVMFGITNRFYVPSSTINTSVSSSGGAFSLGNTGISLGGASTKSTTNIEYSQRVIAIPQKSSYNLDAVPLYQGINGSETRVAVGMTLIGRGYTDKLYTKLFIPKDKKLKENDCCTYSPDNSPINFSFMLCYSFTEDCAATKSITSDFYLKQVVAYNSKSNGNIITNGDKSLLIYNTVGFRDLFLNTEKYFPLGEVRSLNDTESSSKTK